MMLTLVAYSLCVFFLATGTAFAQDTLHLLPETDAGLVTDPNGFLLNPSWRNAGLAAPDIEERCRFRVATGHLEERTLMTTRRHCLSQRERSLVTLSEARTILGLGLACATNSRVGSVRGHINWFPVTATGLLHGLKYSNWGGGDQDINLELVVRTPNALTTGNGRIKELDNRRAYHIEAYIMETLARLPGGESWWHTFRASLTEAGKHLRKDVGDKRVAIVNGIYGLDGVHDFQAELHPIFAMAVLVDSTAIRGAVREEWAIMVRNLGNEGECSTGRFPFNTGDATQREQQFSFDLGWWAGATGVDVSLGGAWVTSPVRYPTPRIEGGGRLLIDFPHDRPVPGVDDYLFLGTLYVTWNGVGAQPWRSRFAEWYPDSLPIALGYQRAHGVSQESIDSLGRDLPSTLPGIGPIREGVVTRIEPLNTMTVRSLNVIRDVPRAAVDGRPGVRAELMIPWVHNPILENCRPEDSDLDPLCRSGWRWAIGGKIKPLRPFGFISMRAHGWRPGGWGIWRAIGTALQAFGWRLDARWDRFVIAADSGEREGASFRLGPVLSSADLRLGAASVVTPYVTGGLGTFVNGRVDLTGSVAGGLHFQYHFQEFFVEYQLSKVFGVGAFDQRALFFGFIFAKPFR